MQKTLIEMAEAWILESVGVSMPTWISTDLTRAFAAGYRSALPETTAEEIAERKSNGEMFLVCHKGEWIYVESITSEGKTYLSQPQGLFWHNVYSWSDYKILGPLRLEVLDERV